VLGIPALKEWQVILLIPGWHMSDKSSESTLLKCDIVKFFPDPNLNTGESLLYTPAASCFFFRFLSAATGQRS